jgi:hypothetical protein
MSNPVAQRDSHANLYNKYLLFLTEYTGKQAGKVCDHRSGRGPEKGHMSEAGHA